MSATGLEWIAILSAALFTAWAIYVTLVEHPARLAAGPAAGVAQFRPSYRRAAIYQASLAVICVLSAIAATIAGGDWVWAAGGLAVGAVIPFTLAVIMPTNLRLLDAAKPLPDVEARALLERWGRLHAVRIVLGALGVAVFVARVITR